jgi:hypothetical protein
MEVKAQNQQSPEVYQVAKQIDAISRAISVENLKAEALIVAEANAMREYDKAMAVQSVKHKIDGMAVTMIKEQAKGDCADLLYNMIIAQKSLKAHWERRQDLRAQLNARQSIYRHLDST